MNFIENFDMNTTHVAVIIENFHINSSGKVKCRIPILMPNIPSGKELLNQTRVSKSNLINKDKSIINVNTIINTSNYILIDLPLWVRKDYTPEIEYTDIVLANKKVLFVFVEGDINNIKILGRYE